LSVIERLVFLTTVRVAAVVTCLLLCGGTAAESDPADDRAAGEVAASIEALRGHSKPNLPMKEYAALDERMEIERKVLLGHPDVARTAIREVLSKEREDSFLIIDLAGLLVMIDREPDALALASSAMLRPDLRIHPDGAARALVRLGSRHCSACLPAVMRSLELWDAKVVLPETGLRFESLGHLRGSLGPYGDDAIPAVIASLDSPDCIVRGNAARALMSLIPDELPVRLRELACKERCLKAQADVWSALGSLDDPRTPALARQCLDMTPSPDAQLRGMIAGGLAGSYLPEALSVLAALRADPDPEVAKLAASVFGTASSNVTWMAEIRAQAERRSDHSERARLVEALEQGERTGHYRMQEPLETFALNLTAEDIPLVNRVRAVVMAQLTDESLLDYTRLDHAVRVMQFLKRTSGRPKPADAAR
jgi:hypothetical protein